MKKIEQSVESLKMLDAWSKWLLTVGSGATGLLIAKDDSFLQNGGVWLQLSVVFFLSAIFFASVTISSIPSIVRRLTEDHDPYKQPLYEPSLLPRFVTVVYPGTLQSIFFWAALVALAIDLFSR